MVAFPPLTECKRRQRLVVGRLPTPGASPAARARSRGEREFV